MFERIAGPGAGAAGSFALAFALHKAASPVRLPLGVALTPAVAGVLGSAESEEDKSSDGL